MPANFNVTTQDLIAISKTLDEISKNYLNEVNAMYNSLEDLMQKWQGAGSAQYYNSIINRKPDVVAIGTVIGQYSSFTNRAAISYDTTDNNVAAQASGRL